MTVSGNIDDDGGHDETNEEGRAHHTQTDTYGSPTMEPGACGYAIEPGPGIDQLTMHRSTHRWRRHL